MNKNQLAMCLMLLLTISTSGGARPTVSINARSNGASNSSSKTTEVKVYLVALNDNGKNGKKIGCDDSLVAITRTIKPTTAPLKAAIEELIKTDNLEQAGLQLGNYWNSDNLKLKSVTLKSGTATIRFTGNIPVAGICDQPRIVEQIEATARQFPTVKRVRVFINKETLETAIS